MSENSKIKWNIDTEIGLIMSQVAKELNVSTAIVKNVMSIYYKNVSVAMESEVVPKINIIGLASIWPVPKMIKHRLDYLVKQNKEKDKDQIEKLTRIYQREKLSREISKGNNKK